MVSGTKETWSNSVRHHKCASAAHGVSYLNDRYFTKSKFKISVWIIFFLEHPCALLEIREYQSHHKVQWKNVNIARLSLM